MYPLKSGVEVRKGPDILHPEPGTYDVDGSFKSTQLLKPRFFIPKGKIVSLAVQASKQKSFVPPPGWYDIDNAFKVLTKGASKGWK
jgi:hypothetical protein